MLPTMLFLMLVSVIQEWWDKRKLTKMSQETELKMKEKYENDMKKQQQPDDKEVEEVEENLKSR